MPKKSAGILLFRIISNEPEVLLVHPGGPFYVKKDLGSWSIPKGEFNDDEEPLHAAIRELQEETGLKVTGDFIELNPIKQKSGKLVFAWALKKDVDVSKIISNNFEMEWPPKSGKQQAFPEIDKAAWFDLETAKQKILLSQIELINDLEHKMNWK